MAGKLSGEILVRRHQAGDRCGAAPAKSAGEMKNPAGVGGVIENYVGAELNFGERTI